jgi:hypothetical protein
MILDPDWNLNKRMMVIANGNARVMRVLPFGLDNDGAFPEEADRRSKAPKLRDDASVDNSFDMVLLLNCSLLWLNEKSLLSSLCASVQQE